jgi:hypothetical protein
MEVDTIAEGSETFSFASVHPLQFRRIFPRLHRKEFADKPQNLADSGETQTKKRKRVANGN